MNFLILLHNSDCVLQNFYKKDLMILRYSSKRYQTYEKNIEPVIDFYKQSNLLKVVNGEAQYLKLAMKLAI